MSTPPEGPRPGDPPKRPPVARPASGAGLAAPRPVAGQTVTISAAAAAQALAAPATAPPAAAAAQGTGLQSGAGAGQLVGVGTSTAAAGTVLGERAGIGQAQTQGVATGRGRGRGQGDAVGRGLTQGTAVAVPTVAAASHGIGARETEPVVEVQPEARTPVATTPVRSSPVVSLFGIRAGQVVSCELAVLGVALVVRERLSILIPVSVAALLVVLLTMIRRSGRFLYQWLALWLRYRTRRRRRRIPGGADAERDEVARTLLGLVARSAEISPTEIEDVEVALISHAGGLTAVLEVVALDAGGFIEPSQALPPLTALLPTAESGRPVVSVQVVIQSIPAPNFVGLEDSAAISYGELAGGIVPATRGCWIALQAQHVAEDYTAADLQDSVIRAVTRLQRRLRKAGLRARILNRDEIATEFLSLARVQPREAALTGSSRRRQKLASPAVTEHWRTWSAGPQVHTTYRVLAWPDLADDEGRELLDRLVRTPTLATTVAVAARWRPGAGPVPEPSTDPAVDPPSTKGNRTNANGNRTNGNANNANRTNGNRTTNDVELEAAVRVTLPDAAAVDLATKQLRTLVEGLGGRIERLDGEQIFGVAATLPLGGFLS